MIGLLFATLNEATPLLHKWPMTLRASVPYPIYDNPQATLILSGMGSVLATSACTYLIEHAKPNVIINAGVSGALSSSTLAIGDLAICDTVSSDSSPRYAITLQPPPSPFSSLWTSLPHTRLVSVSRPVFGGPRRDALSPHAELVDMEGYSVAEVCRTFDLPCLLLKGITDFADTGDRDRLHSNLNQLSENIANTLLSVLQ